MAAQRARDISSGASLTVDRDNDKNPVVALREIADETVSLDALGNALVQGLQTQSEQDEPEEDIVEFDTHMMPSAADQALAQEAALATPAEAEEERKDGVRGRRGPVRVDLGGRRIFNKKK